MKKLFILISIFAFTSCEIREPQRQSRWSAEETHLPAGLVTNKGIDSIQNKKWIAIKREDGQTILVTDDIDAIHFQAIIINDTIK